MEFSLFFVILAFAFYLIPLILVIVLFCKIWEMTNDVKEINHNLFEIAEFMEEYYNERANNK